MNRLLSKLSAATLLILLWCISAAAQVNPTPAGERIPYATECYFSPGNPESWKFDDTYVLDVVFEDDKVYLNNICGSGWTIGSFTEEGSKAVFKSPQRISENMELYAYYKDGKNEIEIPEFTLLVSEDRNEMALSLYEGHDVYLKSVYTASGSVLVKWTGLFLERWLQTPPTPPTDGEVSYLMMNYVNAYETESTKLVDMTRKGNDVWLGNFLQMGYAKGRILDNGDMCFDTPMFVCLDAGLSTYVYTKKNGIESDSFTLKLSDDNSYSLEDGVEIWMGYNSPEWASIYSATLRPIQVYSGAPLPPTNPIWNADFESCFDFDLPLTGPDGEEIPQEWAYWQVLIDGKPFTFTVEQYPILEWSIGNTDVIPATSTFFQMLPSYEMLDWGNLGDHHFRCYLPSYSETDNISVRCGNKAAGSGEIIWSEPVVVKGNLTPNDLPEKALYFTYASLDTETGPYPVNGIAMYAEYGPEKVRFSGFFEQQTFIEGTYDSELRRKAIFPAGQIIGTSDDGQQITLVPARLDSADEGQMLFEKLEEFTLILQDNGNVVMTGKEGIYFLEITGDEITKVWTPGLKLVIVDEEENEIPSEATVSEYKMTYIDIRENEITSDVILAFLNDRVWLKADVNRNFFPDRDLMYTLCLEGRKYGDYISFGLPQYVGVMDNMISYATANPWAFDPTTLEFTGDADGMSYVAEDTELWIGTGFSYPIWRAAKDITLTKKSDSLPAITSDNEIRFINGSFVADNNIQLDVYTTSGIRVDNRNLISGAYIVICEGRAFKMFAK